jgi:hypothetical protein
MEAVDRLRALFDGSRDPWAYCVTEDLDVRMRRSHPLTLKNGRRVMAGECSSCGRPVFRSGPPDSIYTKVTRSGGTIEQSADGINKDAVTDLNESGEA